MASEPRRVRVVCPNCRGDGTAGRGGGDCWWCVGDGWSTATLADPEVEAAIRLAEASLALRLAYEAGDHDAEPFKSATMYAALAAYREKVKHG